MTVHSFYANPAVGGDGTTTTDDSNPLTGLDNGGFRARLLPMFTNIVNIALFVINACVTAATAAQTAATSAVNAPGTSATSVSSLVIGTGSRSLVLAQLGKAFAYGQWVLITDTVTPANFFWAQITAFVAGTGAMTVNVPSGAAFGTGTHTSWSVALTSPYDTTLTGRVTALETEQNRLAVMRRFVLRSLI